MDPFKNLSLSPSSLALSVPLLDSSDEASDERTSFVRSAKSQRKYGSTTSGSSMNDSLSPSRFHPSCHMEHRVQPGETLAGIALRYQTTMEHIKRINKMWTSDTLFLRETLLVPCPAEDFPAGTEAFARLMIENETNGTVFPTLDASCTEIPSVFSEVSLRSMKNNPELARTSSASSASSTSIDCDKNIHDYLGDIDSQIKEAKSKAQKLQKTRLDVRQINFNRLLMFIAGILLFSVAPTLCKKVIFHYTTGTLVGVLGSILIIVYLTSRIIPKKSGAYAVLIGGSSIVFYLIRSLWENMYSVLREYHYYVIAYLAASSVISFAFCYRFGPVTNTRTINLLQWSLQLCGLYLVFESSEHKEGAMAIILVTVVSHNFPGAWWARCQTLWFKRFPPTVRLLTEDEYVDQTRIETERGLKELREFSRSPQCNAWKTMNRLKDPLRMRTKPSPRCIEFVSTPPKNNRNRRSSRFAEFVEGKSHLSDREVLDYETTAYRESETWTDDESDEE
ncbi:nuclear envelope integral membrane protein 1-like isoform X3 [Daphnia pulicaria]|uniref:nuclear envelope integral membrane protein 1-like isoform X3 n=1 Tax=Daphnia pulicaria TaxID=35523 RepID=UPI001EEB5693|nr:nuclear envelope integral membrane protein 1-like isoform X3 [Daphnia pulicaria]